MAADTIKRRRIATKQGVVTVTDTFLNITDFQTGEVCQQLPKGVSLSADGDWFTEEMAEEFFEWRQGGHKGPLPAWCEGATFMTEVTEVGPAVAAAPWEGK